MDSRVCVLIEVWEWASGDIRRLDSEWQLAFLALGVEEEGKQRERGVGDDPTPLRIIS